ncbi:hypothetical protein [Aquimarina sp. I32.4]|uniref:hypothetical protein n=1 Tax=Aquimarina sp. I32.4 TaxID=2053903 RepID=UPI0011AFB723|nr:hypothetical protein [Aquimarina sp. I32.4]
MKLLLKTASVLMLSLCLGCKKNMNDKLLKKEFSSFLMQYYFKYPFIKNSKDVERFTKYVNANHANELDIVKEEKYTIHLDSVTRVLSVESKDGLWGSKATINLDDDAITVLGECEGDRMVMGFYSKNMKLVFESTFMRKIHDAIIEVSKDTLGVPMFIRKGSLRKEERALFIYEEGRVSVSCIKNEMSIEAIQFVQKELLSFLTSQKELPIDYALIPIEVIR